MRLDSVSFVGVQWAAIALVSVLIHTTLAAQASPSWTQVSSGGPTALHRHKMAYDSQRGRTVMFGGVSGNSSTILGDTWEWDGSNWAQVSSTGPAPRGNHAMAYDSQRGRTVLFGGSNILVNTWEWDGNTWTQVATTGPSARTEHAMAYDSLRGRTVLFGGNFPGPPVGDTWEWDGSNWAQVATTGPAGRWSPGMAYDSQRGRTVLFGGNYFNVYFGDTWEWDGSNWMQVSATGPTRTGLAMAYDGQRGRTVLFGGGLSSSPGDTWEWDGSNWTQVATTGPAGRSWHAMAYDSQRGRTVMFGGQTSSGYPGDTWEWIGAVPSIATTFGAGCGNPALALSPVVNAGPIINTTAQASLSNIPSSLAFMAVGWSNTTWGTLTLPFTLAGYGMPGCDLLQSAEAAAIPTTPMGTGTATYSWPLPNWGGLIGLQLYLQGWALAPGANPANVIVSNGVEWVIGNS